MEDGIEKSASGGRPKHRPAAPAAVVMFIKNTPETAFYSILCGGRGKGKGMWIRPPGLHRVPAKTAAAFSGEDGLEGSTRE